MVNYTRQGKINKRIIPPFSILETIYVLGVKRNGNLRIPVVRKQRRVSEDAKLVECWCPGMKGCYIQGVKGLNRFSRVGVLGLGGKIDDIAMNVCTVKPAS